MKKHFAVSLVALMIGTSSVAFADSSSPLMNLPRPSALDMSRLRIIRLAHPIALTDLATKGSVDEVKIHFDTNVPAVPPPPPAPVGVPPVNYPVPPENPTPPAPQPPAHPDPVSVPAPSPSVPGPVPTSIDTVQLIPSIPPPPSPVPVPPGLILPPLLPPGTSVSALVDLPASELANFMPVTNKPGAYGFYIVYSEAATGNTQNKEVLYPLEAWDTLKNDPRCKLGHFFVGGMVQVKCTYSSTTILSSAKRCVVPHFATQNCVCPSGYEAKAEYSRILKEPGMIKSIGKFACMPKP